MNCWHCNSELIWGGDHDLEESQDEEYKEIFDKQINSKYGEEFFDIISRILFIKEQVESPRRS